MESGVFKSVELEYEWEKDMKTRNGDICLSDNLGNDIHIEVWDGRTKQSYHMARRIILGELDEASRFEDWPDANKKLAKKVKQLRILDGTSSSLICRRAS